MKSIKTKLITTMLLVAAIPLIVAVMISYFTSTAKATEDAKTELASQANFLQAELGTIFQNNKKALEGFASSPTTIDFLKGDESKASIVKNQMITVTNTFTDENTIVLSNSKGMMVQRSDDSKFIDISDRAYFKSAMSGTPYVSEIVVSASTHARNVCVAVPVYDYDIKTVIGCVHRSYEVGNLHALLSESVDEGFIVDNVGILAAHSDYEITADDEPVDFSSSPYMTSGLDKDIYISSATGSKAYVAYAKEPMSGFTCCVAKDVSSVVSEARKSAILIVSIGIAMLIVVFIFSFIMANGYTKPILAVNDVLSKLANGEFFRVDKYTDRQDEFGHMIRNSNAVIDKLDAIVGHIKSSSSTVSVSSDELSVMANQIASTTETVAEAVQEIAAGASEQALSVQRSAENAGRITDAIENVQSSTTDLNSLASRMKEASEASGSSLNEFHMSSMVMNEKILEITEKISATQSAVAEINEHVVGISGIASQTNLLSLNASIEAARAGDAGRGFAVVAEEIRKLADDSENLASEIQNVMDTLLEQSAEAVNAANEIIESNKAQQTSLGETLKAVEGMLGDIETTVASVASISEETTTCVDSNRVVSEAMTSLSAISEENAASTETTGASVEELSATVTTLAESADSLKSVAEKLNEEIAFFK